ncbi:archaemetzincin-2 [Latimeria chalumnae]|uniref:Archaemetzincin-2 n=1 Tax=Latimeria chalumnae TaxID=7897 RepID=H3BAH9_LATCH|nr:PREDICTED: archaemetzincin-2 [Latimeria chalumnae]XP_005992219.1 PREDICTED: archaemetzincin-2 [Latimeria chalumnae]XP_005992220.1 PREDICTED: archaemetzincin-2 [Latimeria chalumnae]XP_005992221.1 PREDICTED: archaemetzincin-2 [Latimeria chalumnae]|eukprot:XP_005992218.1 PREDICTED: archaemetzincin-2 [Latimeria chalumnae]
MQVIQHSEQALKAALISNREDLIELYQKFSVCEKCLLEESFRPDSFLFKPISLHSKSDWILSHPEPKQDFEQFYSNLYRIAPTAKKNVIYIQTIGSFGDSEISTKEYVLWLKDYCEVFYYGLPVKILEPVPVSETCCAFRINEHSLNLQIHAGDLLKYLKKKKPKDAFCIVGITMIDLYPEDSWNFVFGQASMTEGIGIFSFARYDDDFYTTAYKGRLKTNQKLKPRDYSVFNGYYTPPVTSILLFRSCRTLTHEIGHIFGMHHCQWLQCVMQGSNHLEESDRRPIDLCPVCLRKLQFVVGFNISQRYRALLKWIDQGSSALDHGATASTEAHSQKPVEAFIESKKWLLKCLCLLEE